jgi:hypothetical protein
MELVPMQASKGGIMATICNDVPGMTVKYYSVR